MKKLFRKKIFLFIFTLLLVPSMLTLTASTGMKCNAGVTVQSAPLLLEKPNFPEDYYSKEESSFLIFPEWYIVFSADEYGAFLKSHQPSHFPYFAAIKQFWQSYACVVQYTNGKYEFNGENNLVSVVIGISYSFEYATKGMYELSLGKINEVLANNETVEEEIFAQTVAEEYGTFLHTQAWFLFPFWEKLAQLWTETDLLGHNLLRKWERKIILSTEYIGKGIYAWALKKATYSTIGEPDLTTEIWSSNLPPSLASSSASITVLDNLDDTSDIIQVPRYEEFKLTVPILFENGVTIYEVGGNDTIFATVLAPENWQSSYYPFLFEMNIVSKPGIKRVGIPLPVTKIDTFLKDIKSDSVQLEHIYDY